MAETRPVVGEDLSDSEKVLLEKLFSNPRIWPDSAKVWIADYVSQNSLLPISQIQGFTQIVPQKATILDSSAETTTSTSYTDLSTVGPTITGLSAGQYLIIYGLSMGGSSGSGITTYCSPSINGAAATTADEIYYFNGPGPSFASAFVSRTLLKTLTANNNSVQLKYKTSSGTGSFGACWIIALRVANP